MRLLVLAAVLGGGVCFAQDGLTPPPVGPAEDEPTEAAPASPVTAPPAPAQAVQPAPVPVQASYFDRCFALPAQVYVPAPSPGHYFLVTGSRRQQPLSELHPAVPVTTPPSDAPTSTSSGGSPSGGGGGLGNIGDGKALLVVAVVLAAALPIILYVVDADAPAITEQRFFCPTLGFDSSGGIDFRGGQPVGGGTGRFSFGYGHLGADFQFELSAGAINAWSTHLQLRFTPKRVLEPALAAGYRAYALDGVTRGGPDFSVPSRIVFWREGLKTVALELRPSLVVNLIGAGGFDLGLEGALLFPIFEPLQLRVGGRVQSFGNELIGGVNAGLAFVL